MTPEQALFDAINAYPALIAKVGNRVTPDFVREERPLPAIAYQRVATDYQNTIHGPALAHISTFEIYAMAKTRTDSLALGDLFDDAMRSAKLYCSNRRAEFDDDYKVWSNVFTLTILINL